MRGVCVGVLSFASVAAGQGVLHVDQKAPVPGNGGSWTTPLRYLQDALTIAKKPGSMVSEIRVAQGVYTPDKGTDITPGDRTASFNLLTGVTIKGGYAGTGQTNPDERNIDAYITELSGDLNGDDSLGSFAVAENSYHVVRAVGVAASGTLDGFRVVRGNADGISETSVGAGLYSMNASPTVVSCRFWHNASENNGRDIRIENGQLSLTSCEFAFPPVGSFRIGVYSSKGNPSLSKCMFLSVPVGAFYATDGSPVLEGCRFEKCSAAQTVCDLSKCGPETLVRNCVFERNTAESLRLTGTAARLEECVFLRNDSKGGTATMNVWRGVVRGSDFIQNRSGIEGGGLTIYPSAGSYICAGGAGLIRRLSGGSWEMLGTTNPTGIVHAIQNHEMGWGTLLAVGGTFSFPSPAPLRPTESPHGTARSGPKWAPGSTTAPTTRSAR
jgi:hypothetical protein